MTKPSQSGSELRFSTLRASAEIANRNRFDLGSDDLRGSDADVLSDGGEWRHVLFSWVRTAVMNEWLERVEAT